MIFSHKHEFMIDALLFYIYFLRMGSSTFICGTFFEDSLFELTRFFYWDCISIVSDFVL